MKDGWQLHLMQTQCHPEQRLCKAKQHVLKLKLSQEFISMKNIRLLFFCLSLVSAVRAQTVMTFSNEPAQFIKDLSFFMTQNKMEVSITAMNAFEKLSKDGKLPSAWSEKMAKLCNQMTERNMSPATHFVPYLEAVGEAAKRPLNDAQFSAWSDFISDIIDAQKKGDNGPFLKTMDFSAALFSQNALMATASKTWKTDPVDFKFNSEGLRPFVSFPLTTLYGMVKGDTISVKQTSGNYYPLETTWEGNSGRVDWSRVGLPPDKVYCTFKKYSVNVTSFSYTVDTVSFVHIEYYKTPLSGKLTDKMMTSADSATLNYPRFYSYDIGMTVKDFAPNVSYTGGFSMNGAKVYGYGTTEEKAMLTFYAADGRTKLMSARSSDITIKKGDQLGADKAEIAIYFGTDSIYHPQLSLVYKVAKREMRLLRSETGIGKSKFNDSYHNYEFQTDAVFWNMDSPVLNLKILSGVGQKPGVYESINYFNKELLRKTQGYTSYEPLAMLKRLSEQSGSRDVNPTEFARTIDPNMKEGEIKSLLYELVENGFILYNEELGIITVKDKTINYVLSNAKKIDYDIIHLNSLPKKENDRIDFSTNNIDLKWVSKVPISDTAFVYFQPKDGAISLQKDRNMEFDGVIYAGRTDLTGQKYKFNYAPFTVDLTKVDTMVLYIPDSAGRTDPFGNPILVQMKSRIENITGLLEVDAKINKSGRTRLLQFPKLHSNEKSNVYYDDPAIAKGAYTRKNFFFELEPFRLDSMGIFSPGMVNWPGTFVSAGIFPDLQNRISIQRDRSLGFGGESPPDGYPLYNGKGTYYGSYKLNYSGLQADGRITHSTADFTSHDIFLYPDSMRGTTDTFTITKTFDGVQTPAVTGNSDMIFWKPAADSMHILMTDKAKPFTMYDDGFTTFKGNLLLTATGLRGDGTLDWNEATLSSKDFSFRTMALSADTSALNIKTTGDKVTFKTPNVNAKVDFDTRIGDFVSNEKNIPTDFSWNKYTTAINQFKWFMDEKILDFKAPPDGPGEYFTSTKSDQKGLKFLGKRAIYYLVTSLLRIEQVPEIRVADASVVPDSGIVIIEEDAKMNQLRNAVIIADTVNKTHRIENCTVDIYSKTELKAIGDYHYDTKDIKEIISFNDISTKRETEGKNRKEKEFYLLTAKANLDESKNFVIYPDVNFNGEATLLSVNKFLNFKGYAKLGLKYPKASTTDFFINQDVDPNTLSLQYDTTAKSSTGNKLTSGIHLNPSPDAPAVYTTLMFPKQEARDITLFQSTGVITQNAAGEYLFGDSNKIKNNDQPGNLLRYDDKKGIAKADGKFNFGTNFGIIKTLAAGSAEGRLDSAKYKFNLTFGIDMKLEDKMQEKFEFFMLGDNADQPDINYDNARQRQAVRNLADAKDDKKLLDEFYASSAFIKRPKALDHNIVFNDVTFVFDRDDISLRSEGKIGVSFLGKKVINKKLEGYIEYQYKGGTDIFTIYLETGTKGWFFFEYRPGMLSIVSSYDEINNSIGAVAPDKRKIIGDNKRFYVYGLGSTLNKRDFVQYMKDKAAGIIKPRPEPHIEIIPEEIIMPGDSVSSDSADMNGLNIRKQQQHEINQIEQMKMNNQSLLSGPPPDRKKKKEKKADPAPEEEQQMPEETQPAPEQQQQINEMERMRMSNQNILSGPPPGRDKPKEEPKPEPVPVEQPREEMPQAAPKLEVQPEVPEEEIIVPKEESKQEQVPQEQPKEGISVPKEEPKLDVPQEAKPEAAPVQESETQTQPETVPVIPVVPVTEEPVKSDTLPSAPALTPEIHQIDSVPH